ncbi:hypothetical protein PFICI_03054 [Pestalotiopsis fici W106-1]|uniref:Metallo-beta-lactamase domain-containing protein n=1 Tax=Pestalotiopsis fici (strain W106-1 / CGMCC3.15140) TaxID=1229662 RepID=W3XG92_PESFW|nr:uncharacterized protein PFICI_03054 [Pestalotiopsis fici W106-1]ETS85029.1 hypothetical protein PFICI_03054 [Pestalotiopsis fici W106-1]
MSKVQIPPSTATVQVSIVDTTFGGYAPTAHFMGPPIDGFETFRAVAYAFVITHTDEKGTERRVVFDLGTPKDLVNDFPPAVAAQLAQLSSNLTVAKNTSDVLSQGGLDLESIEALIWSHAHPDHVGRPSLFPSSCDLLVGPGIKQAFFPGWPTIAESPVLEREFQGRQVREVDFSSSNLKIGGLGAVDYFGDGSFYLLDAPGHAIGHMNALARTTSDTFILLAGDSFHHGSELRPHPGAALPESVSFQGGKCCDTAVFKSIHPNTSGIEVPERYVKALQHPHGGCSQVPFHTISQKATGETLSHDIEVTRETLRAIQGFDADPNIFVIAAHDATLYDVLEYLPKLANDWQKKGWKAQTRWYFLEDLMPTFNGTGRLE